MQKNLVVRSSQKMRSLLKMQTSEKIRDKIFDADSLLDSVHYILSLTLVIVSQITINGHQDDDRNYLSLNCQCSEIGPNITFMKST